MHMFQTSSSPAAAARNSALYRPNHKAPCSLMMHQQAYWSGNRSPPWTRCVASIYPITSIPPIWRRTETVRGGWQSSIATGDWQSSIATCQPHILKIQVSPDYLYQFATEGKRWSPSSISPEQTGHMLSKSKSFYREWSRVDTLQLKVFFFLRGSTT